MDRNAETSTGGIDENSRANSPELSGGHQLAERSECANSNALALLTTNQRPTTGGAQRRPGRHITKWYQNSHQVVPKLSAVAGSQRRADYFRWRIRARIRRFLRPSLRRPFPDFLTPMILSTPQSIQHRPRCENGSETRKPASYRKPLLESIKRKVGRLLSRNIACEPRVDSGQSITDGF